jgi:hypothetical protein
LGKRAVYRGELQLETYSCGAAAALTVRCKQKKEKHKSMEEILDEIEKRNSQKRYSKLSIITSLITMGLLGYLFSTIPKTIKASEGLPEPPMIIVVATQIFLLNWNNNDRFEFYKEGTFNLVQMGRRNFKYSFIFNNCRFSNICKNSIIKWRFGNFN